jgi:hypothetical protein
MDRSSALGGDELLDVIRGVRRRWQLRTALRGALIVLLAFAVVFIVSAWGIDRLRYGSGSVLAARLALYAALLALVVRYLVLPFRNRVTDQQVALYLEEHEPTLEAAVVSAVDASGMRAGAPHVSPAFVREVVERAIAACRRVEDGRRIEKAVLRQLSAATVIALAAGALALLFGPPFLRHAAPFLVVPWNARAASPYAIEVTPGDSTVARGADQAVTARLHGFDAERVEIAVQAGEDGEWKRLPMTADEGGGAYQMMLFDLGASTRYFVEASGVRSPVYRLEVADLAYVKRIDLEYHFPDYTGLPPRRVDDGGDIAALAGTQVTVNVVPTLPVGAGRLVVEKGASVDLKPAEDGSLQGVVEVTRNGFYKVELMAREGMRPASPDYAIEVLSDEPPSVSFLKPGRDARVTPIEEVFTEVKAEDDYGLGRLDLVYSVNGGPEQTRTLYRGGAGQKTVTASHTFFLEELGLQPGDFISYFARATDNRTATPQTATTDIYFMEARPFSREYRQAEQRGAPGGGGGADGALSHQQRQIVAATFKLARDRASTPEKQYREDLGALSLAQGRLLEQVETLVKRMSARGLVEAEADFRRTAESLEAATTEMASARDILGQAKSKEALPPEQKALQHLQRAEAAFRDVQVSFGNAPGAGGGQELAAEDLADLFELELDKLRNQYETVQRGGRQQADERIDEAMQRLAELARRQQQENERTKALNGRMPNGGGGGGQQQRQLAEQAEELARKLERLAREQRGGAAEESARRLREAADAMRRAAAEKRDSGMAEGLSALDRLQEARRLLDKDRAGRLDRGLEDVQKRAEALRSAQERIASEVSNLGQSGGESRERLSRLLERKDALGQQVQSLERDLDQLSRDARRDQKEAARKLQEAADSIRDNKLNEKIRYSKSVVQGRSPEYARQFEGQIASDIQELERRIGEASRTAAAGGSKDRRAASLDKTRELVQRMESLGERLRDRQGTARRSGRAQDGRAQDGREAGSQAEKGDKGKDGSRAEPGSPLDADRRRAADARNGEQGGAEPSQRGQGGSAGGDQGMAPGTFSDEQIRQFRREVRERLKEAEELQRELPEGGPWGSDLRGIVKRMRGFDNQAPYGDPRGIEQLAAAVVEDLKMFEYNLRRSAEGGRQKLLLSASDEVPEGWRSLVEEYYRKLSEKRAP